MAYIEQEIPDDIDIKIQRLVDEGEFNSYEEAIREILSSGLTAYRIDDNNEDDFEDFNPMEPSNHEDDYVF